jgi:hypothetical protein
MELHGASPLIVRKKDVERELIYIYIYIYEGLKKQKKQKKLTSVTHPHKDGGRGACIGHSPPSILKKKKKIKVKNKL